MIAALERYAIQGGREGYDRLQVLARSRWPDTRDLFERVGVSAGMQCIDLGCGGGEVTFELTRMVGPAGHAVGVDMDEVKLDLARKDAAARGMSNVEFRTANVNEWDDPAAYDLVYCRFLLEHLGQPDELLQRMWAAVRPGGTIAVEATDFDGEFGEPPNEAFATAQRLYRALVDHRGGDPVAGRRMFRRFLDAGIPRPSVRLVQRVHHVESDVGGGAVRLLPDLLWLVTRRLLSKRRARSCVDRNRTGSFHDALGPLPGAHGNLCERSRHLGSDGPSHRRHRRR